MNNPGDVSESRVCKTEDGRFIAFWRGQLVRKLDGALRYFATDQAARSFLAVRDTVSGSIVGRVDRAKPTKGRCARGWTLKSGLEHP
jgi:hypothetical protein